MQIKLNLKSVNTKKHLWKKKPMYSDNSKFLDALLLLSLRVREVNDERIVTSTSCLSSALLGDMIDHQLLDYAQSSGNYVITEKGRLMLSRLKEAPWDSNHVFKLASTQYKIAAI